MILTIDRKNFADKEASRVMNDEFDSERTQVKRMVRGKGINPERYDMVCCSNCNGSGRYFYANRGVNVCQICGGFGLMRMERNWMYDASEIIVSV
jgi:DnaJ-class molecular chaperone